jgi:hypothetical protein
MISSYLLEIKNHINLHLGAYLATAIFNGCYYSRGIIKDAKLCVAESPNLTFDIEFLESSVS